MSNEKTHFEKGTSELQFSISKERLLQQLRECAENVKKGFAATINIPVNKYHLKSGTYSGEELGAVIYFIADMLE